MTRSWGSFIEISALVFLSFSEAGSQPLPAQSWELVEGTGGIVLADILFAPSNPDSVYVLGDSLLLSTDRGLHWGVVGPGSDIGRLAVDPGNPSQLYMNETGVPFQGNVLKKSLDGGREWTELFHGICHEKIGCAAPELESDQLDPSVLFAVANPVFLVRTIDNGITWDSVLSLPYFSLWDVEVSPADNDVIYATYARPVRLVKSIDSGVTWSDLPFPLFGVDAEFVLACDPRNSDLLYAALDGFGVYKSTDGGLNWRDINSGLSTDDRDVRVLLINPANPTEIFLGLADETPFDGKSGLVFVSLDEGETWAPIVEGLPFSGHISAMAMDPEGLKLFACVNSIVDSADYSGVYAFSFQSNGVEDEGEDLPIVEALIQNYPNPFNGETTIGFRLPHRSFVRLRIYSLLGEEVATIAEGEYPAGQNTVVFDASGLSSGLYFYSLLVNRDIHTRSLILLK